MPPRPPMWRSGVNQLVGKTDQQVTLPSSDWIHFRRAGDQIGRMEAAQFPSVRGGNALPDFCREVGIGVCAERLVMNSGELAKFLKGNTGICGTDREGVVG